MNLENLKNRLPDYAKDIKLNLANILSNENELDVNQKAHIVLGVVYTLKNSFMIACCLEEITLILSEPEIQAAKAAAIIMAMNNIYYRFTHSIHDKSFATMPAKLRMNVLANPGTDKNSFELTCLAISAINGCSMCMDSHTHALSKARVSKLAIQAAVRIAAVLNAAATAINIAE